MALPSPVYDRLQMPHPPGSKVRRLEASTATESEIQTRPYPVPSKALRSPSQHTTIRTASLEHYLGWVQEALAIQSVRRAGVEVHVREGKEAALTNVGGAGWNFDFQLHRCKKRMLSEIGGGQSLDATSLSGSWRQKRVRCRSRPASG